MPLRSIVIVALSLHPAGPVKRAIALAGARPVTSFAVQTGPGADPPTDFPIDCLAPAERECMRLRCERRARQRLGQAR